MDQRKLVISAPAICKNCEWWHRHSAEPSDPPNTVESGECKRFPPALFQTDDGAIVMSPVTEWHDWCGEFKMHTDA